MSFAKITSDFSYWKKQEKPLFSDLYWNIPEQKTGHIAIIGGSSAGVSTEIRLAELLEKSFPVSSVKLLLPDALQGKLPPLPNIDFTPSTISGSFAKSNLISAAIDNSDFALLPGDLSKNSATAVAISESVTAANPDIPLLITRDAVDALTPTIETLLTRGHIFIFTSLSQLQKIFRAVFYPRMLMLSAPLTSLIETLHKFTLSYSATLITFHEGSLIVAFAGNIITTRLADTGYSPLTLWSGELAAKITALNLYNPEKPLEATSAALLGA